MKVFKWIVGIVLILILGFYYILVYPEMCQTHIARSLASQTDVKIITERIEKYQSVMGQYPSNTRELVPEYIKKVPVNPWGYEYQYNVNEDQELEVYSLGSDGAKGGVGTALDVYKDTSTQDIIRSIKKPFVGCNA